ncbi:7796_t:CDS:2 [Entrophospora sp. SA101]|nr:7796_t:CDS:2 [Entrophospora sp. SA101]
MEGYRYTAEKVKNFHNPQLPNKLQENFGFAFLEKNNQIDDVQKETLSIKEQEKFNNSLLEFIQISEIMSIQNNHEYPK